ncbi:MAG: DUF2461 domain-containing protein [Bacteroidota bacterium]
MQPDFEELIFPPFEGFPKQGFDFLRRLKKNNNRDWFLKHKSEYEDLVKFPMQCYVASLKPLFHDFAPEFDLNPKKALFRIYRDTRFSKDKTPYKTHSAAHFELKKKPKLFDGAGYYVHVAPGEVFIGGGIYIPDHDRLKKIRKALVERSDEFLTILNEKRFKKMFKSLEGEKLTRPPKGYTPDHPMIEYIKFKQFFVGLEWNEEAAYKKEFLKKSADAFAVATPLLRFLNEAIDA